MDFTGHETKRVIEAHQEQRLVGFTYFRCIQRGMTKKEQRRVNDCIENEGFDYAFTSYSHFEEVKDPEFHRLREAFLQARKALAEYVGSEA